MFPRLWQKHVITFMGLTIALLFIPTTTSEETKIISLPNGKVKGMAMHTVYGREYFGFQGIPYGKPPIGKLRFQPPVKADPWDGVLDATKPLTLCPEPFHYHKSSYNNGHPSEDCLTINVYTPQVNDTFQELYAVIIHIYGGANMVGPTVWEGQYRLLDRNVLFVLPLYRIGILGYGTTLDEYLPGNYGQLDQLLAAQWVQDNIAYFGGDAKRVTMMGHSSGAADVNFHVASPLSKGLFRNAIAMSMCPITETVALITTKTNTKLAARRLQCPTDDSKSILKCLMNASAKTLTKDIYVNTNGIKQFFPNTDNISGYMPQKTYKQIFEPTVQKIPMMIGILPNEGATPDKLAHVITSLNSPEKATSFFSKIFPRVISLFGYTKDVDAIVQLIKKEYNIHNESEMTPKDVYDLIVEVSTEFMFKYGCDCNIAFLTRAGFQIFAYYFTHEYPFHHLQFLGKSLSHSAEMPFIMKIDKEQNFTGEDYTASEEMIDLWTNFAIYGEPTPREFIEKKRNHPNWEPWTFSHPKHLLLNAHPKMESGNFSKKNKFWNKIAAHYQEED